MRRSRHLVILVAAIFAGLVLCAPDGLSAPLDIRAGRDKNLGHAQLLADGSEKSIRISFPKLPSKVLFFDTQAEDRGAVFSGDVDCDGDTDFFWISTSKAVEVVVLLGDGRGNFTIADRRYAASLKHFFPQTIHQDNTASCDSESVAFPRVPVMVLPALAGLFEAREARHHTAAAESLPRYDSCITVLKRGPPAHPCLF